MNKLILWSCASSVLLALVPACGSDSSGGGAPSTEELVASCKKTCNKLVSCLPDSGGLFTINCDSTCSPSTFQQGSGGAQSTAPACDYGKVKAKLDECANVDCTALQSCQAEAAAICRSTGAGGSSSGTGGSVSGAGGSVIGAGGSIPGGGGAATGTGTCADCERANACCKTQAAMAGADPAQCDGFSKATCDSAGAQMGPLIQACSALASACR